MNEHYVIVPLENGPEGIRKLYSPTVKIEAYIIPREYFRVFRNYDVAKRAGVYILYNKQQTELYIGQTGSDFIGRLDNHNKTKDFWDTAIVFTTDSKDLTPTHAKILESRIISRAKELGLKTNNRANSFEPDVDEIIKKTSEKWEEEIVYITKLLNISFFIQKKVENKKTKKSDSFVYKKCPINYTIYNKSYEFRTWKQITRDLCERIIDVKGYEEFKNKVTSSKKLEKKILTDENKMTSSGEYERYRDVYINLHAGSNELNALNKNISELFDGFDIKYNY